jgi:glucose-1-phosphate cytidylyltransferase
MKAVILAGGQGTRLAEETEVKPKPMVEIGGKPMLWHIMKIYAAYGCSEFILALGYKGEVIKNYFLNYYLWESDISIHLAKGQVEARNGCKEDWCIHLIDTGPRTQTGGRIKRLASWVGNETFMLTYGDAVANIDIASLLDFHRKHGKLATVTAVRPPARFGGITLQNDQVVHFKEKPQIGEGWINGGFFVLEPAVLNYIEGDAVEWEHEPLERLTAEGQLVAYRHNGFWQSMDTLRDVRVLESFWQGCEPPWKVWAG